VKFKYWPEDLSKIAVWNQVRQAYVKIPCTQADYAKGLSEHHHQVLTRYAEQQGLKFSSEDERCAARTRLREKIASFVNNRKIGDRRRAQRLAASPQYVPEALPELGNPPELAGKDHIIPIETVSNRVNGDQPDRSAVRRLSKKVGRSGRLVPGMATPESLATSESPPEHYASDPFASFDREKLLAAVEAESEECHGS
jgi:putative transposase